MTSIRKLASALCFCFLSLVCNAQTTSGDLINDGQWTGVTYGADPGGCCASISGSAPLYDTTTNTIMYSYGQNTISQTIGINQALGGTGIQVNGYNYNWDYRLISNNGNGGDTLTATISLKNSAGNVTETQNFTYTGSTHDIWYTESGSTTFTNPYTDPLSVTLSFTGKDGGFWAGYYGPELRNINLSLNYTVGQDPCVTDPLSSTTCPGYAEAYKSQQCSMNPLYDSSCPGYAEALQKILDEQAALGTTSESDLVSSVIIESTSPSSSVSDPVKDETQVTTDVGGAELSTTGEVIVSTGAPEVKETKETTEEKQTAESTTSATIETTEKKKSSVNALAVAQNAAREAEATALSVTEAAVTASLSESANPGDGINLELGTGLTLAGSQTPFGLGSNELQASLVSSDVLGQAARSRQNSLDTASTETVQTENKKSEILTTEVAIATTESTTEEKSQSGSSVRRGSVVEGMEGGADMDALSKPPTGFNSYLSAQLQDGQFYAPKEIYKNQRNVDNARAFRGLGSDRLHQQMVESQWDITR